MTMRTAIIQTVLVLVPLVACAGPQVEVTKSQPTAGAAVATQTKPADLLPNGKAPFEGILVGGQPSPAQFEVLADQGYGTIVNLRGPDENGNTDPAQIESLGMQYFALPIIGADSLNEQNARKLGEILAQADAPVVVHCASGNRVGGLFALKAYYFDGKSPEEALAIGRQAGMTRTQAAVEQKLRLE